MDLSVGRELGSREANCETFKIAQLERIKFDSIVVGD